MRGSPYEQDTSDMNSEPAAVTAKKYSKLIVGIKVAHYRGGLWHPVDAAVKAGTIAHIPVMIDFGGHLPPLSIQELFENHLRANDIFTHCFAQLRDRESVVDTITKQIKPFIKQAQQKPIIFDVGYGEISFTFKQAIPAVTQGFLPNSISTDIHVGATHDILDIMSQFLAMGVDLPQVISMTTANPAKEIKHQELGGLQKGAVADIAILAIKKGQFQFTDHTGQSIQGSQKLECIWTIRAGRIVYQHAGRIVYQHFCPIFTSHS